jgi:hypothetical protein
VISLALPSELRRSSAFRHVFRGQLTWHCDMGTRIADRYEARRTEQQGRVARCLEAMAGCLICTRWRARPPTATRRLPNPVLAWWALPLAPTCTAPFLGVGAAEQNVIGLPATRC